MSCVAVIGFATIALGITLRTAHPALPVRDRQRFPQPWWYHTALLPISGQEIGCVKRAEVTILPVETLVLRVIEVIQLWVTLADRVLHPLVAVPTLFPSASLQIP